MNLSNLKPAGCDLAQAASAGLASGKATAQKVCAEVRPRVRATSSTQIDCCTKLARAGTNLSSICGVNSIASSASI